jgi:hypothetical protein
MNNFREILKINWFTYKWREYNRDDWIQINSLDNMYEIVFWDWTVINADNKEQLIWTLAIHNIINRLF